MPASQRLRQLNGLLVSRGPAAAVPPEQSSVSVAGKAGYESVGDVKAVLYRALEGADRGIFGMTSARRSEIHGLVELLESRNPTPEPTAKLHEKVQAYELRREQWHLGFWLHVILCFYFFKIQPNIYY
jgi:hypothetical protein